jgi:predicted lactoylglutathione lyase
MAQMIFVNLPVSDVAKSTEFYTGLGFTKNDQFSDETTSSIVLSDTIVFQIMTHEKFKGFTNKSIIDAKTQVQALFALSRDSREAVDEIVNKALATGGAPAQDAQDHGFMYGWSFDDPDGHTIEVMWMDPAALEG